MSDSHDQKQRDYLSAQLDNKLQALGYSAPENYVNNNSYYSPYKAYDEKDKDTYISQNNSVYATFDEKIENPKTNEKLENNIKPKDDFVVVNSKLCPVCNMQALYICRCKKQEMMCKNKHMWYYENKKVVLGDPHDGEE